ncbi:hypothetical protein VdG2_00228 [Verticillium dahliae VDG2]|nr:hypothetical protein VdG2_00228 [Verticillium dahliae VDG2]
MTSSDNQHFRKILPAEAGLESAGTTATTSSSASAHAEALPTSLPCPSNTLEESERSKQQVDGYGDPFVIRLLRKLMKIGSTQYLRH